MLKIGKKKKDFIDFEIEQVLIQMSQLDPDSEEYTKMVNNLKTLYEAKGEVSKNKVGFKDVLPLVGSLGGIALIVIVEKSDILMSKAMNFVHKPKI